MITDEPVKPLWFRMPHSPFPTGSILHRIWMLRHQCIITNCTIMALDHRGIRIQGRNNVIITDCTMSNVTFNDLTKYPLWQNIRNFVARVIWERYT